MNVRIWFKDGRTQMVASDDTIQTEPDRSMSERKFYIDVALGEHQEMDCSGGGEDPCPTCERNVRAWCEIQAEEERRIALGIGVDDPAAETFEERFAPYGTEWQLEQRERAEGR